MLIAPLTTKDTKAFNSQVLYPHQSRQCMLLVANPYYSHAGICITTFLLCSLLNYKDEGKQNSVVNTANGHQMHLTANHTMPTKLKLQRDIFCNGHRWQAVHSPTTKEAQEWKMTCLAAVLLSSTSLIFSWPCNFYRFMLNDLQQRRTERWHHETRWHKPYKTRRVHNVLHKHTIL